MDIKTALHEYIKLGDYFAPDYERDNDVLIAFKQNNPRLNEQQTAELLTILNDSDLHNKFFVADLLYLYKDFSPLLFDPMIEAAINYKDPSFNRIFLRPCLFNFGIKRVVDALADKFITGDIIRRISISKLCYWLAPDTMEDIAKLKTIMTLRARETTNLIELYHYRHYCPEGMPGNIRIPENAEELVTMVKGNKEYEDLLFNGLGWIRSNTN